MQIVFQNTVSIVCMWFGFVGSLISMKAIFSRNFFLVLNDILHEARNNKTNQVSPKVSFNPEKQYDSYISSLIGFLYLLVAFTGEFMISFKADPIYICDATTKNIIITTMICLGFFLSIHLTLYVSKHVIKKYLRLMIEANATLEDAWVTKD